MMNECAMNIGASYGFMKVFLILMKTMFKQYFFPTYLTLFFFKMLQLQV